MFSLRLGSFSAWCHFRIRDALQEQWSGSLPSPQCRGTNANPRNTTCQPWDVLLPVGSQFHKQHLQSRISWGFPYLQNVCLYSAVGTGHHTGSHDKNSQLHTRSCGFLGLILHVVVDRAHCEEAEPLTPLHSQTTEKFWASLLGTLISE